MVAKYGTVPAAGEIVVKSAYPRLAYLRAFVRGLVSKGKTTKHLAACYDSNLLSLPEFGGRHPIGPLSRLQQEHVRDIMARVRNAAKQAKMSAAQLQSHREQAAAEPTKQDATDRAAAATSGKFNLTRLYMDHLFVKPDPELGRVAFELIFKNRTTPAGASVDCQLGGGFAQVHKLLEHWIRMNSAHPDIITAACRKLADATTGALWDHLEKSSFAQGKVDDVIKRAMLERYRFQQVGGVEIWEAFLHGIGIPDDDRGGQEAVPPSFPYRYRFVFCDFIQIWWCFFTGSGFNVWHPILSNIQDGSTASASSSKPRAAADVDVASLAGVLAHNIEDRLQSYIAPGKPKHSTTGASLLAASSSATAAGATAAVSSLAAASTVPGQASTPGTEDSIVVDPILSVSYVRADEDPQRLLIDELGDAIAGPSWLDESVLDADDDDGTDTSSECPELEAFSDDGDD